MGKRKKSSRGPQGPKKREPLATSFQCLFCNHENSVTVKLYKKEGIGQLDCRICGQSYSSSINYLSAAVDVYSDWIDACEAVAGQTEGEKASAIDKAAERRIFTSARPREPTARTSGGVEDDLDGFIENDEPEDDQEQRYTLEDD